MLIENVVFNFHEVGEKSFEEIKNECLVHFASRLREALTTRDERVRKFWLDSSIANYKVFSDYFGSKIKYNSKSIVFEETLHNDLNSPWSLRSTCMDVYGLEYIEPADEASGYYRYRKGNPVSTRTCDTCCCEFVGDRLEPEIAEEAVRNFYKSFGVGEFPFMTITMIRLGNKDHYFYTIHR